jgi:hypothetical protein
MSLRRANDDISGKLFSRSSQAFDRTNHLIEIKPRQGLDLVLSGIGECDFEPPCWITSRIPTNVDHVSVRQSHEEQILLPILDRHVLAKGENEGEK